ncbi:unnamed protein product [Amoebophrya sp. A120]|nr:unnamed protein product [Amoebophrya sp. A120]|eukprot:GSA120T00021063001.1
MIWGTSTLPPTLCLPSLSRDRFRKLPYGFAAPPVAEPFVPQGISAYLQMFLALG